MTRPDAAAKTSGGGCSAGPGPSTSPVSGERAESLVSHAPPRGPEDGGIESDGALAPLSTASPNAGTPYGLSRSVPFGVVGQRDSRRDGTTSTRSPSLLALGMRWATGRAG